MASVSEPVPISGKPNGSTNNMNLSTSPTAIDPATPVMPSQGLAMMDSIPKHKGEAEFRILFDLPNATLLDGSYSPIPLIQPSTTTMPIHVTVPNQTQGQDKVDFVNFTRFALRNLS